MNYKVIETTNVRTFDVEINDNFLDGVIQTDKGAGLVYKTSSSFSEYLTLPQLKYIVEAMEELEKQFTIKD